MMKRSCILFFLTLCLLVSASVCLATSEETDEPIVWPSDSVVIPATPAPETKNEPTVAPKATTETQPGTMSITLTFTGDLTIGTNYKAYRNMNASIFGKELKRQGGDPNFYLRNIKDILLSDDLTVVNFEGTLADSVTIPASKRENQFLFLAPLSYADTLLPNGIEAATLENNHVMDFGENGYQSTMDALQQAGIVCANSTQIGVCDISGIRIGLLAYQTFNGGYDRIYATLEQDIQKARDMGCQIVTVSYHWGDEKDYAPNSRQQKLAKTTIDYGADLVVGHHSHRINPIEEYNGKYIVYSLGNFSFAGHNKPSDMLTYLFQIRFKYRRGEMFGTDFRIIPCRISSKQDYNDFTVTPLTETRYIDTILSTLRNYGSKVDHPVENYPLEWD